ncbi:hypothetical protein RFI_05377 [Reticulomyxa filosa]|uniref:Uncharacterized protein n=1 Tax=Reticulomyxa filosa TaxID=46433 RepID=X6P0T6_RETFI|nr:hypothetical protein RFI_05377 [Reticulomyxa filosa]|eukprot:ETO31743.1 hypothetical protein RFI_05377 [Reticulomyxa filosa]
MVITNYNGELAQVSGGTPIECTWKLYKQNSNNLNIYQCSISGISIMGLRVNGTRAIRARYPNANPETQGFGSTLQAKSWLSPSPPYLPSYQFNPYYPIRNDTFCCCNKIGGTELLTFFFFFEKKKGMGGPCANFTPPAGYWCSSNPQGGGATTYRIPYGMTYNTSILPHSPYHNVNGGVVQAWRPGHWASWMFTIDSTKSKSGEFIFSRGGFQDARGNNAGDEFYVENLFEELDAPSEWFFNSSANTLYYYNNRTGAPTFDEFEATNLKVLFSLVGNMSYPVANMTIRGLTLRDTQYTYMDNHGMPSGGDWALQRTGAIYLKALKISPFSTMS